MKSATNAVESSEVGMTGPFSESLGALGQFWQNGLE